MLNLVCTALYGLTILLMLSSICLVIARGGRNRISYSFCFVQLMIILWSAGQLLILNSVNTEQFFASVCISHFAVCFIGSLWLAFALFYSEIRFKRQIMTVSLLISAGHYIMVVTSRLNHLFYRSVSFRALDYGIFFKTHFVFTYICVFWGTALIIITCFKRKKYSRGQGILLAAAVIIPMSLNFIYVFKIVPSPMDLTPLGFGASSVLTLFATYGYGFLNVNSVAFENAVKNIDEGFVLCRPDGKITFFNSAAEAFIDTKNKHSVIDFLKKADESGEILNEEKEMTEKETELDGKFLNIKRYNYTGSKNELLAFSVVISDVSRYYELLKNSNQVAALNTRLEIEKERSRIAQEVHDTAGHTLTVLNTLARVSGIAAEKGCLDEVKENMHEAERLASSGIARLRAAINNMKNDKKFNCVSQGLYELADTVSGIDTEVFIQGQDGEKYIFLADIFYKCAREAVTNALRYSNADKIDIIARLGERRAELFIIDNGKGCESIKVGNGLDGIIKRVKAAGGSTEFISRKDEGFRVKISIPVKEEEK